MFSPIKTSFKTEHAFAIIFSAFILATTLISQSWSDFISVANQTIQTLPATRTQLAQAVSALDSPSSGLVGWWKFDEGSGTVAGDASGNGNNGMLVNGPTWTTDSNVGTVAVQFDGVNDYILSNNSFSSIVGASEKTFSFWAKPASITNSGRPFTLCKSAVNTAYAVALINSRWWLSYRDTSDVLQSRNSTASAAMLNTWAFITVVQSGSNIALYTNGVLKLSYTDAGIPIPSSPPNAGLGAYTCSTPNNFFSGSLDDVRFYNRALSAGEIQELYALGSPSTLDTEAPSAPTNLSATAISSSQINLSWTASADNIAVAGYKIYRGGAEIGTTASNSYSNTSLSANTSYIYTISAYDAAGNTSTQSTSVSATTPSGSVFTYTLAVSKLGTGAGIVSGSSINCGGTCTQSNITSGTSITLTATPSSGYMFSSWGGLCSGSNTTCTLTISANTAVSATFAQQPTGPSTYYIDFAYGNNTNNGTSQQTSWKNAPGDPNATDNPKSVSLKPGDTILFKKGITYDGQINVPASGSKITEGGSGTVNSGGNLIDNNANFNNVMAGDYIYIYHSLPSGNEIESTGLWQVKSVNSQTSLTLNGFNDLPYSIPELSYKIYRTISYTSDSSYGSGEAILTGSGIRDRIFNINGRKNAIRIANLSLINTRDPATENCTNVTRGAVSNSNTNSPYAEGLIVENLNISNVWSGILADYANYPVFRGNVIKHFGNFGIVGSRYALIENNYIEDGVGGIRNSMEYSVLRFNTIIDMDRTGPSACGYHSDGIGPIFSGSSNPGGNKYGWIYSNWIQNTVEGIYLSLTNNGTDHWTIANNVIVGSVGYTGMGDAAITANSSPNIRIFNNIIIGLNDQTGWGTAIYAGPYIPYTTNAEIKNNIIYNPANSGMTAMSVRSGSATLVSEGNFIYYPRISPTTQIFARTDETTGIATNYTFAQWQQAGFDNAGYSASSTNPLFVDPVGILKSDFDLRLQANSLAKNSPYSLPNNLRDFAGVMRYAGQPWDRGAYEYVSGDGTPTPINGSCSTTLNQCTAGTFSDITDTSTNYLWSCLGSNGGTTASCSLPITSVTLTTPIVGDFNNDGLVNSIDLSLMITAWNTSNTTYDLNRDGRVNSLDYVMMVRNWTV